MKLKNDIKQFPTVGFLRAVFSNDFKIPCMILLVFDFTNQMVTKECSQDQGVVPAEWWMGFQLIR